MKNAGLTGIYTQYTGFSQTRDIIPGHYHAFKEKKALKQAVNALAAKYKVRRWIS